MQHGRGVLAGGLRGRRRGLLGRRRGGRQGRVLLPAGRARGAPRECTSRAARAWRARCALRAAGAALAAGVLGLGPAQEAWILAAACCEKMFPMGLGHELWHRGEMLNKNIQNHAHLQQFLSGWRPCGAREKTQSAISETGSSYYALNYNL